MIRKFTAAAFAALAFASGSTFANDAQDVAAVIEKLRVAMVDPTPAALDAVVANELTYGHSGGKVDTKASFISDLLDGKSDFVTIKLTEQTVNVVGDVALVRHTLAADTNDSGKPGTVNLKILLVFQKQAGQWKLLARQAVRVPT